MATVTAPELLTARTAPELLTARLPLRLVALDPIHHGGGVSGNVSRIRRQTIFTSDGRLVDVPFISGNSVRHQLRAALAEHTCRILGVAEHSLPKRVADLLWSGGALTSTGNQIDLQAQRDVDRLAPMVSLLGYSARSDIVAGPLRADNIHIVCAENAWRLPADLADHPHAAVPRGQMIGMEFGTRHDVAGGPASRWIKIDDLLSRIDETIQMIFEMQVIRPGTVLWGCLYLDVASRAQADALAVAIDEAWPDQGDGTRLIILGGKGSSGFGRCSLRVGTFPLGDLAEARARHEALLIDNRDALLDLLTTTVG